MQAQIRSNTHNYNPGQTKTEYFTSIFLISVCVHALKGLALPRASHSGEIAPAAGSRRLRSTLAAAPFLFAHAVATETKK